MELIKAVKEELVIESYILAFEIDTANPQLMNEIEDI